MTAAATTTRPVVRRSTSTNASKHAFAAFSPFRPRNSTASNVTFPAQGHNLDLWPGQLASETSRHDFYVSVGAGSQTAVLVHNCPDRVYEQSPKHGLNSYMRAGQIVSRAPTGDVQGALEAAQPMGGGSTALLGTEDETGLQIVFRLTQNVTDADGNVVQQIFHGYVPGG